MPIKIAELIVAIGAETAPAVAGLNQVDSKMKNTTSMGGMLSKALGPMGVAGAVMAVGKFAMDSVSDWSEYAEAMMHAADNAGISTEEMSRLTQAADDFRVEQSALESAMIMALKNGFAPTIENLAALSDQYLALESPADRAALASKIFGRQYADMAPLLLQGGDAIRGATAAIDDNLIVTGAAAAENMGYIASVDQLQDSWTGIKNEIGKEIIPVLTTLMDSVNRSTDRVNEYNSYIGDLQKALASTAITQDEYNHLMGEAYRKYKLTAGSTEELTQIHAALREKMDAASDSTKNMTLLMDGLYTAEDMTRIATGNLAAGIPELTDEYKKFIEESEKIQGLDKNFGDIVNYAQKYALILRDVNEKQERMNELVLALDSGGLDALGLSAEDAQDEIRVLTGDIDTLQQSMTDMANQVVLDMLMATISIGGISETEAKIYFKLAEDMKLISKDAADAAMQAYGGAIDYINGLLIDPKTGNVYIDAEAFWAEMKIIRLAEIDDKFAKIIAEVDNYDEIEKRLNDLARDRYFVMHGSYDMPAEMRAGGGDVEKGKLYKVGEQGWEWFVAPQNGYILPHTEAVSMGYDQSDNRKSVVNNYYYSVTMPTALNPVDVITAFDLVRTYGV